MQDGGGINLIRSRETTSLGFDDSVVTDNKSSNVKGPDSNGGSTSKAVCSLVQDALASMTPSQWWTTHFPDILAASQHQQDRNFVYKNWTLALLASLSPEMLQQGVRARPSGNALDRVATILHKRITDPDNGPPLNIAVVGGSVTRGQGCHIPVLGAHRFHPTVCAWPSRLERLINTLAGMKVVQVYNLAVSATNLQFGTPLVKYWLYPKELLLNGPDVIVSSYSTNEQALRVDTTTSVKYANEERDRVQEFITSSRLARPCDPPLIVFVDDYLGNRQDVILGEMTFNKVVTELAEWYGEVMHVSYADVVRRAIYANTNESIFTSPWPVETSGEYRGQPQVEVHFGMGGHVAIAWSFLYAIVDVFSGYCDNQAFVDKMHREGHKGVFSQNIVDMVNDVPPPELTTSLLLQKVSREWQDNAVRMRQSQSECNGTVVAESPCSFAFLFGPDATLRNPKMLNDYLRPFLVSKNGWKATMEFGSGGTVKKPGLVATGANASMTIQLTNIDKVVRVINLQRIKSYGPKWAGSKARFTVRVENPGKAGYQTQFDVKGYHADISR